MRPNDIMFERCTHCNDFTGRGGVTEDSLYLKESGPLCENCYEAKRVPEGWSVRPVAAADSDVKGFVIGTPRTADGVRHNTSIWSDTDDPAEQLLYALLATAPEAGE